MIQRKLFSLILTLSMVLAMPALAYGEEPDSFDAPADINVSAMDGERAVSDELLVLVEEGTSKKEIKNIAEDAGASLDSVSTLGDGKKLASINLDDPKDAQEVADSLAAEGKVLIVQPNYRYKLQEEEVEEMLVEEPEGITLNKQTDPADPPPPEETDEEEPLESEKGIHIEIDDEHEASVHEEIRDDMWITQWYLGNDYSGSDKGFKSWEKLSGNTNKTKVAIIDTGVKLDHPDLEDAIIADECVEIVNKETAEFDADGFDDNDGHGTHVSGIIAAKAGDDFGISGISDNRAELIVIDAYKKYDKETEASFHTDDVVAAIEYAIDKDADVINMSIGALVTDLILEREINQATYENNVLCVCAAGNEESYLPETPGDASGALSVMAHDENGKPAYFTNYGKEKEVSAPGTDIVSTYVDNPRYDAVIYKQMDGTSMAAPMVTGLAALIKAENPSLNVREIKNYIFTSSKSESFTDRSGFGRINAVNAVDAVNSSTKSPSKVVLNKTSISMHVSESTGIEYVVYPAVASTYADELTFTSSDSAVASVDARGLVTAQKAGEATITAKCRGKSASCKVKVSNPPYTRINTIKYSTNGTFSPTDFKTEFKNIHDNKYLEMNADYSAFADGYEVKLYKEHGKISISLFSKLAIPYIRVFDKDGNEIETDLKIENKGTSRFPRYTTSASFTPSSTAVYRIQALGVCDGDNEVDKEYSLTITPENIVKEPMSDVVVSNLGSRTYTGSYITQEPVVKHNGFTLVKDTDYTVSYSDNKYIGEASVKFTGLGAYEGSITKNFKILPKGASMSKLKKGKKAVTVKWKKQSSMMPKARINGYQVQVATDSKFTRNVKTASVKGYKKTSKKIGKLKKKTKYYVRIRTYIKTGGTTYYSGWSKVKSTKTR